MNINTISVSSGNGPGLRLVIWFQGCSLGCHQCFNPQTHDYGSKLLFDPESLLALTLNFMSTNKLRGVTLSGGEPLEQAKDVLAYLKSLPSSLDILLFTGYTKDEILGDNLRRSVVCSCDAVLSGRYVSRSNKHPLASKNLLLITDRIQASELSFHQTVSVNVSSDALLYSGFPRVPLALDGQRL